MKSRLLQIALCFTPVSWLALCSALLPSSVCLHFMPIFFSCCDLHQCSCLQIKAQFFFPGVSFIAGVCLLCVRAGQSRSAVLLCPRHLMVWRGGVVYIRPGAAWSQVGGRSYGNWHRRGSTWKEIQSGRPLGFAAVCSADLRGVCLF